ncbi:MAG: hypothetical protein ACJ8HU_03750 [Chthoniobacterales bacterium]
MRIWRAVIAAACLTATVCLAGDVDNVAAKLFTPQIAERVLGGVVEPASQNTAADMQNGGNVVSRAGYTLQGAGSAAPRVSILLRRSATAEETKTAFLNSKEMYHGVDVAGFGDAAYRIDKPAQFNVLKGRDWIVITAGVFPAPDPALQEKTARELLAALKN